MESIDKVDRSHQIKYRKRSNSIKPKELRLVAFTDSDYANDEKIGKALQEEL